MSSARQIASARVVVAVFAAALLGCVFLVAAFPFTAHADGLSAANSDQNETAVEAAVVQASTATQPVYRMVEPASGAQRLVAGAKQRAKLLKSRWRCEGAAFDAPDESDIPVHEFSNRKTGARFYTASAKDCARYRKSVNWRDLGVAFYASAKGVPVYRLYNPRLHARVYATGASARKSLVKAGCTYEKVAWHAAKGGRASDWVSTLKVAGKASQLIVVEASGTRAAVSMHVRKAGKWKRIVSTANGWVASAVRAKGSTIRPRAS